MPDGNTSPSRDAAGVGADDIVGLDDVWILDERPILKGISWRVRRGERWVVLGPNGAGKSTLIQVASTYRFPSRGRVTVLGHRIGAFDVREIRPHIGYTSAELERMLDKRMTALDAVLTSKHALLRRWRDSYDETETKRAATLLDDMGLAGMEDRSIGTLSEGERRRVQIARALMGDPELLLLDEPAAGLDVGGREHLVAVMRDLASGPVPGIVFVTHHVEEIPPGFTHAALLRSGRLVAAGPIGEALTSATMSDCFGLALDVEERAGRFIAHAVHAGGAAQ